MAIYSTSIAELTRRVASKKTSGKKKQQPPKNEETARERTNRLARERRARKKQEELDQAAGVTLATGKVDLPVRDEEDPVHLAPKEKAAVPRPSHSPAATAQQQPSPQTNKKGKQAAAPAPNESEDTGASQENQDPDDDTEEESSEDDDEEEQQSEPNTSTTEKALPVKKKRRTRGSGGSFPDTPPKWYTKLLTEVIKTKMTEAGEKASAKAIKETGDEMAKERWADPEEQAKMRASQDKLYSQIFRY